jgi:adenosylcobinamide kinase / adenosylcobinamide-phosphate guanylyltransferase
MNSLTLVTGGSRSGKSAFAQQMVEGWEGPRLFLATCPVSDLEMEERIRKHRRQRQGRGWQTQEEGLLLVEQLRCTPPGTHVLIDCLSLWISNLMAEGRCLSEEDISSHCTLLVEAAQAHQGRVVMVSGEVGLGLVPDNPVARCFRDLAGRCNQVMAAHAQKVFFVCCGIPVQIK